MKTKIALAFMLSLLALVGCGKKEETFKVDANDPSSVANSSQTEPNLMSSDGQRVDPNTGEATPPAKQ